MSAFSAAASDEDGDTIKQLRGALQQARDWITEHPDRRPISAGRMVAILTNALAAASQPPVVEQQPRYLAGGARYKVTHLADAGYCIHGLPREMLGKWVAFVDATDNKHMDSQRPQSVTDCHQSQPKGEPVGLLPLDCRGGYANLQPQGDQSEPTDSMGIPLSELLRGVHLLYTCPLNLNCKSNQARLATLWGYEKPQSKCQPLTDEQQIAEAMRRHGLVLVKTVNGYDVLKLGQITAHGITGEAK